MSEAPRRTTHALPPRVTGEQVSFEDYLHYAELQREREARDGPIVYSDASNNIADDHGLKGEKEKGDIEATVRSSRDQVLDGMADEHVNARRALRVASWWAVFFLITTDILGPFNAPFSVANIGYVPGAVLYFFMGGIACYTGLLLWKLFVKLDSDEYPIRTYADIAERLYGMWARHLVNVLQSLQLIINVGLICLTNGQSLIQILQTKGKSFCFSVIIVFWVLFGIVVGQIRTLKNFGWLANSAVWINLLIIFITMGAVAKSGPNIPVAITTYGPGIGTGPVVTQNFAKLPLFSQVNGVMNMVFAYGGAMIFPEFMAEMRRPMDFWKGMCAAQLLIFSAYMVFGLFVYHFQGQYTLPQAYQGIKALGLQTVANVFGMISGIIAAGLYGNIGIKVAYINIIEDWLRGPSLLSRKGRLIWAGMVFVYWSLAFVIVSAIPQVGSVSSLVAAACIMQFTYTFPPGLILGYHIRVDAMRADAPHVPGSAPTGRIDTWAHWSRWQRGIFTGHVWFKAMNFIFFLGGAATAALGMWGAIESIKATFAAGAAATSFGCTAPV